MDTDKAEGRSFEEDIKISWSQFLRGFSIAFACRSALSVLLRILQLARSGQFSDVLSIENVFSEKSLIVRVDAVRIGLFVGQFSGGYELLTRMASRVRQTNDYKNSLIGGFLSGLSLLYLGEEDRRSVSLYALARVAQCVYNLLKQRNLWHFWGSDWGHGDALLFALTSAQIMYAYVMRPTSLPASYYKFIQRTGPIAEEVLEGVRAVNRHLEVNVDSLLRYVKSENKNTMFTLTRAYPPPPILGCDALHPTCDGCVKNSGRVLLSAFKKVLPVYGSLTLVSVIVVGFSRFIRNPLRGLFHGVRDTFRSTLFLSSFVAIYQAGVCTQRKMVLSDHRIIYWLSGFISAGLSILIEKKSRRSELALYALPRALDSFYTILYDRKWLGSLPQGELLLFSLSCAGIMYCHHHEPQALSPILKWVISKVFERDGKQSNKS